MRKHLHDTPCRIDAVQPGQRDIHDHNIGLGFQDDVGCGAAIRGLTNDDEIRLVLKKAAQPFTENSLIIDDDDSVSHLLAIRLIYFWTFL